MYREPTSSGLGTLLKRFENSSDASAWGFLTRRRCSCDHSSSGLDFVVALIKLAAQRDPAVVLRAG